MDIHLRTHVFTIRKDILSVLSLSLSINSTTWRIHTVRDMPLEVCIHCSHGKTPGETLDPSAGFPA